jgi:hypothetical protein
MFSCDRSATHFVGIAEVCKPAVIYYVYASKGLRELYPLFCVKMMEGVLPKSVWKCLRKKKKIPIQKGFEPFKMQKAILLFV